MASRFMWQLFFSLENAKNPACEMQKGPGFMAALAGFVMGLAPRRPQAGFDLFNQIGAGKLYGKSSDYGRKGGWVLKAGSVCGIGEKIALWQFFAIMRCKVCMFFIKLNFLQNNAN